MPITPAHITAGASVVSALGSLLGSSSESGHYNKTQRRQVAQNMDLQRKAFYEPIQTTVRDANRAGIHPLYAMGSGGNFSPTSVIPGQTSSGSSAGDKLRQIGQAVGSAAMQTAQINAVNASAKRDEAAAALAESQAAQLNQAVNPTGSGRVEIGPVGLVETVPSQQVSARPEDAGTQAGKGTPFFKEYHLGRALGFDMSVFGPASEEPAEALENVGGILLSIPRNVQHALKGAIGPYVRLAARIYNSKAPAKAKAVALKKLKQYFWSQQR